VKNFTGPTCPWDRRVDPQNHLCDCGRPAPLQWTCEHCLDDLRTLLDSLAELEEQLTVALTRAHAASYSGGTHSTGETPLPYNDQAAKKLKLLLAAMTRWAERCTPGALPRVATLTALSRTIASELNQLPYQPWTRSMLTELRSIARDAHDVALWQPNEREFIGRCEGTPPTDEDPASHPCPGEVYAKTPGSSTGICDTCGRGYSADRLYSSMQRRLDDQLCTATEIARLTNILGADIPTERIRDRIYTWHKRGLIQQKGTQQGPGKTKRPTFRYGEVRPLIERDPHLRRRP
jgi:hypothetical protein